MPGGLRRGSVGDLRLSVVSLRRGGVEGKLWPPLGTLKFSLVWGFRQRCGWHGWRGCGLERWEGVAASRALPV